MHENTITVKRPWYREPWVWLMIALPASAVIGGIITIYLAVVTSDGLVEDDYYKRGKTINLELARDQAAASYNLQATLVLNPETGQVQVTLDSRDDLRPDHVRLLLLHPTQAGKDQHLQLEFTGKGVYFGRTEPIILANWHVQLETDDWRLSGRMKIPVQTSIRLVPQNTPALNNLGKQ